MRVLKRGGEDFCGVEAEKRWDKADAKSPERGVRGRVELQGDGTSSLQVIFTTTLRSAYSLKIAFI